MATINENNKRKQPDDDEQLDHQTPQGPKRPMARRNGNPGKRKAVADDGPTTSPKTPAQLAKANRMKLLHTIRNRSKLDSTAVLDGDEYTVEDVISRAIGTTSDSPRISNQWGYLTDADALDSIEVLNDLGDVTGAPDLIPLLTARTKRNDFQNARIKASLDAYDSVEKGVEDIALKLYGDAMGGKQYTYALAAARKFLPSDVVSKLVAEHNAKHPTHYVVDAGEVGLLSALMRDVARHVGDISNTVFTAMTNKDGGKVMGIQVESLRKQMLLDRDQANNRLQIHSSQIGKVPVYAKELITDAPVVVNGVAVPRKPRYIYKKNLNGSVHPVSKPNFRALGPSPVLTEAINDLTVAQLHPALAAKFKLIIQELGMVCLNNMTGAISPIGMVARFKKVALVSSTVANQKAGKFLQPNLMSVQNYLNVAYGLDESQYKDNAIRDSWNWLTAAKGKTNIKMQMQFLSFEADQEELAQNFPGGRPQINFDSAAGLPFPLSVKKGQVIELVQDLMHHLFEHLKSFLSIKENSDLWAVARTGTPRGFKANNVLYGKLVSSMANNKNLPGSSGCYAKVKSEISKIGVPTNIPGYLEKPQPEIRERVANTAAAFVSMSPLSKTRIYYVMNAYHTLGPVVLRLINSISSKGLGGGFREQMGLLHAQIIPLRKFAPGQFDIVAKCLLNSSPFDASARLKPEIQRYGRFFVYSDNLYWVFVAQVDLYIDAYRMSSIQVIGPGLEQAGDLIKISKGSTVTLSMDGSKWEAHGTPGHAYQWFSETAKYLPKELAPYWLLFIGNQAINVPAILGTVHYRTPGMATGCPSTFALNDELMWSVALQTKQILVDQHFNEEGHDQNRFLGRMLDSLKTLGIIMELERAIVQSFDPVIAGQDLTSEESADQSSLNLDGTFLKLDLLGHSGYISRLDTIPPALQAFQPNPGMPDFRQSVFIPTLTNDSGGDEGSNRLLRTIAFGNQASDFPQLAELGRLVSAYLFGGMLSSTLSILIQRMIEITRVKVTQEIAKIAKIEPGDTPAVRDAKFDVARKLAMQSISDGLDVPTDLVDTVLSHGAGAVTMQTLVKLFSGLGTISADHININRSDLSFNPFTTAVNVFTDLSLSVEEMKQQGKIRKTTPEHFLLTLCLEVIRLRGKDMDVVDPASPAGKPDLNPKILNSLVTPFLRMLTTTLDQLKASGMLVFAQSLSRHVSQTLGLQDLTVKADVAKRLSKFVKGNTNKLLLLLGITPNPDETPAKKARKAIQPTSKAPRLNPNRGKVGTRVPIVDSEVVFSNKNLSQTKTAAGKDTLKGLLMAVCTLDKGVPVMAAPDAPGIQLRSVFKKGGDTSPPTFLKFGRNNFYRLGIKAVSIQSFDFITNPTQWPIWDTLFTKVPLVVSTVKPTIPMDELLTVAGVNLLKKQAEEHSRSRDSNPLEASYYVFSSSNVTNLTKRTFFITNNGDFVMTNHSDSGLDLVPDSSITFLPTHAHVNLFSR